ncbi:MAG: hypothetical protein CVV53_00140 [Spirochaetae bacterium HGW-Spirochaetae-9]|nr:MAG: hypothetical protein CVV53_00140 [Spirochaetae bacterium HGW-Spirochaetae-9]
MAYAVALFFSALIAAAVAALAWKRRGTLGAGGLFVVMASIVVWTGTYSIRWLMSNDTAATFWLDATYLGVVAAPSAMFCLAYQFVNGTKALSLKKILLLAPMPCATLILIWTDKYHGFFYGGARTTTAILTGGPWFFVNAAYLYILNLATLVILARTAVKAKGLYARQILILIFALVLPWTGNILSIAGLSPLPGLDLTPFLFTLSGIVLAYGLFKYKLMDIIPIARDFLVEHMSEGFVVVDDRNRLVDINPSACSILGIGRKDIGTIFPGDNARLRDKAAQFSDNLEASFELDMGDRWYGVQVSSFDEERRNLHGRVYILRDMTQQKRINEELRYRGTHDILTGLFNRQRYEMEFARLEKSRSALSLVMADLDGLKALNDTLGHGEGDNVIRAAAALLAETVGGAGLLARAGGDEFLVILEGAGEMETREVVEKIRDRIARFNGKREGAPETAGWHSLSLSLGAATRLPGEPLEMTLKRADDAMYGEKNSKKD